MGNYINSILALREALDSGAEEALMLDNEGYVAEGSGENFFMIRDGVIYTPDLTSCPRWHHSTKHFSDCR